MAYLIASKCQGKWQINIYSEPNISMCGDINTNQILLDQASGNSFHEARNILIRRLLKNFSLEEEKPVCVIM
jgi:hypothetical protein